MAMKINQQLGLGLMILLAFFGLNLWAGDDLADVPPRMANGALITGVLKEASPEGLVFQGEKGQYTVPWKHLSAGTRYRYEAQAVAGNKGAPKSTGGKAVKVVPTRRPAK